LLVTGDEAVLPDKKKKKKKKKKNRNLLI